MSGKSLRSLISCRLYYVRDSDESSNSSEDEATSVDFWFKPSKSRLQNN